MSKDKKWRLGLSIAVLVGVILIGAGMGCLIRAMLPEDAPENLRQLASVGSMLTSFGVGVIGGEIIVHILGSGSQE